MELGLFVCNPASAEPNDAAKFSKEGRGVDQGYLCSALGNALEGSANLTERVWRLEATSRAREFQIQCCQEAGCAPGDAAGGWTLPRSSYELLIIIARIDINPAFGKRKFRNSLAIS